MIVKQKTPELYEEIRRLSNVCFIGTERPPDDKLFAMLDAGVICVQRAGTTPTAMLIAFGIGIIRDGQSWLFELGTDPAYRRLGQGRMCLLELMHFYAKAGYSTMGLTVKINNPNALILYLSNGFEITRVEKNYYRDGTDGVFMQRKL